MMHLFYLRERSGLSDSQNLKKKKNSQSVSFSRKFFSCPVFSENFNWDNRNYRFLCCTHVLPL